MADQVLHKLGRYDQNYSKYSAIALSAYDAGSTLLLWRQMMLIIAFDALSANYPRNISLLFQHMVIVRINC